MDQQLSFITVAAADLDVVRRFYIEGLGWTPLLDVPGEIVFFQVGHGLVLGFFEAEHFVADVGVQSAVSATPGGYTLSHSVPNPAAVDRVVAEAETAGARVIKRPQRADFGGYHGHFVDPVGVIWEVAHNSGWHVDADGTVSLGPVTD